MNELHLFAGAGGGILGGELLGHTTVCAVEIEEYPRRVLLQRQRDGILPKFPIWDDICTFDGKPWNGIVDIVAGGFPCQDISSAGKGAGITGGKSGLWGQMSRVVSEVRPKFVFVENSPNLVTRGLGRVIGDLSEMGYDARWCVMGSGHIGGKHCRERIWILGYSDEVRLQRHDIKRKIQSKGGSSEATYKGRLGQRHDLPEPYYIRSSDGVDNRSHRLKAIGNGQVPAVAATAFSILSEGLI